MNNPFSKKLAFFSIFLIILTWASTALATTYQMPIAFSHQLTSVIRYFDGQNIAFEATPHTYPDSHFPDAQPIDSVYRVTLKRYNGWPNSDDTVGTTLMPRNSFGKAV